MSSALEIYPIKIEVGDGGQNSNLYNSFDSLVEEK